MTCESMEDALLLSLKKSLVTVLILNFCLGCMKGKNSEAKTVLKAESYIPEEANLKVCFVVGGKKLDYAAFFERKKFPPIAPSVREFPAEIRQSIISIVQQEFTKKSTGITFSGFEDCKAPHGPSMEEATIFVFNSAHGRADAAGNAQHNYDNYEETSRVWRQNAENSATTRENLPSRISLSLEGFCARAPSKSVFDQCIKMVALHEFGHAAGLGHSHEHPDAIKDPACRSGIPDALQSLVGKLSGRVAYVAGPYLEGSVMNYCHMEHFVLNNGRSKIRNIELLAEERELIKQRAPVKKGFWNWF